MTDRSLADPRLQAIEVHLNDGDLDAAQVLLADLGETLKFRYETTYLTTRLLFERGKLTALEVAERLRELLAAVDYFPEATQLIAQAEAGVLRPRFGGPNSSNRSGSPQPTYPPPPGAAMPTNADLSPPWDEPTAPPPRVTDSRADSRSPLTPRGSRTKGGYRVSGLEIPKAPNIPSFVPSTARSPSEEPPPEQDFDAGTDEDTGPFSGGPLSAPRVPSRRASMPTMASPPPMPSAPPVVDSSPLSDRRGAQSNVATSRRPTPGRATRVSRMPSSPAFSGTIAERAKALLEKERYSEALFILDQQSPTDSAEISLLIARALLGVGVHERAISILERISQAPLVEPDHRADCARLWLEAGHTRQALEQAQIALDEDPLAPWVRLVAAWALTRSARRKDRDPPTLAKIEELLRDLEDEETRHADIVESLRACLLVEKGDARRGLDTAKRALAISPRSVDALVAASTACAALARFRDAQTYWLRLFRTAYEEAKALRERLAASEIFLVEADAATPPSSGEVGAHEVWDPLEVALVSGERTALLSAWEQNAHLSLLHLGQEATPPGLSKGAELAARCFSQTPGFTHFGPFDLSLWSLMRLETALDIVYGAVPRIIASPEVRWLVSSYVGEALRLAYDGRWVVDPQHLENAHVVTSRGDVFVFREVERRLLFGSPMAIEAYIDVASAHPGAAPWRSRRRIKTDPPIPWGSSTWPSLAGVEALGRAMSYSVISLYCERHGDGPLDGSLAGLATLDSYLSLVAPPLAEPNPSDPCVKRAAVLVGAYVGEVLRRSLGGYWQKPSAPPSMKEEDVGAQDYIVITGDLATRPIGQVMDRLCGISKVPIADYAHAVADQV